MNVTFPSFAQWKQIFKVLKKKEKNTLLVFFLLFITSFSFLVIHFYISNTIISPAFGGTYTEILSLTLPTLMTFLQMEKLTPLPSKIIYCGMINDPLPLTM